ncbi:lipase [Bacterioplanes sanyensis]|uniref:lipase family alpha/beta hydrolase n=1 Tax=Bacterioplanes sanyensis TaxID=1249553 RepID=UPI0016790742|nr:triacylglycerol lipase [Bacterioplanes sanyensis]GGY52083.1 lipase [Bacterioplanes sanyensis]
MNAKTLIMFISVLLFHSTLWAMSKAPAEQGYTATRYPIVLTHGLYGFDSLLGIDYWYKVPETLREGGAEVFVTQVSNSNSPQIRGEQLIPQIEEILAITGADKVNLIGHSHGGPTTRYVASVRPDLVASVTAIAGVNKGTPVAEALHNWSEGSDAFAGLISTLGNSLAKVIDLLSGGGQPQDILASMQSMTFAETARFNQQHPGGIPRTECGEGDYEYNGVRYYSWSGAKPLTNVLDPLDLLTGTTRLFFPAGEKNDGLVGSCASRLGMVIRDDFRMNHLDEVNMTLGLHDLTETDPLTVFRTHANRLQQAGL